MAYHYADGTRQPLCSFAGQEEAVLQKLPRGGPWHRIADDRRYYPCAADERGAGSHLRQEWTPYVLASAADMRGEDVLRVLLYQDKKQMPLVPLLDKALGEAADSLLAERVAPDLLVSDPGAVSGTAMLDAVCPPVGCAAEELARRAAAPDAGADASGEPKRGPADAPAELRLAAAQTTLTDHDTGRAAEYLYNLARGAEKTA